jgi:hypothetical protein
MSHKWWCEAICDSMKAGVSCQSHSTLVVAPSELNASPLLRILLLPRGGHFCTRVALICTVYAFFSLSIPSSVPEEVLAAYRRGTVYMKSEISARSDNQDPWSDQSRHYFSDAYVAH